MEAETLITSYLDWLKKVYEAASIMDAERPWCMLGMPTDENAVSLTQEAFLGYFDRTDLNNLYVKEYTNKDSTTRKPHSYIKAEANIIYGFHKGMVARHKTRIQHYRDDCSQKTYRTWNSVVMGFARFKADKYAVDNPNHTGTV